ncbi:MAG: transposase [Selenomonadaceae bacterium]|nr:transposase [Selenomonadaceae bacterium]
MSTNINVVERFFLQIKIRRRIVTRYDKVAVCFLYFVILCALLIQL